MKTQNSQRKARLYSVSNFLVGGMVMGAIAGFFITDRPGEKLIMSVFLALFWGGSLAAFAAVSNKIEHMKARKREARSAR